MLHKIFKSVLCLMAIAMVMVSCEKKDTKEVNKYDILSRKDSWAIVGADATGVVAGGRIGKYFGVPWGAGIGMVVGAAFCSYAEYVSQGYSIPYNYEIVKVGDVVFSDKLEDMGIGHNALLNQLVTGERTDKDFLFDDRISKYFSSENSKYDEKTALEIEKAQVIQKLYNDIKTKGFDSAINPIINNGSSIVKETISKFKRELLQVNDYKGCIELIRSYKNNIEKSNSFNAEDKEEMMAFLVVAKYSAHYWNSAQ